MSEKRENIQLIDEKYRILFKKLPTPTYIWKKIGEDLFLADFNDAANKIVGGNMKDFIGIKATDLYKDRPKIIEELYQCVEGEEVQPREILYQYITIDKPRNLYVSYECIPPDLIMIHADDITKQKKAEQYLKESEEKFKTITEQSMVGIGILQDNQFKYINEAITKIIEFSKEEMENWTIKDLSDRIHPEDRQFAMGQAKKKQEGESEVVINYAYRIITKSGKIKWIDQYSKTILYEGKPADLSIVIDITDKILAEQNLSESEQKYKTLIEHISDAIIEADVGGKFHYASPQIEMIFGYSAEEVVGRHSAINIHPDDLSNFAEKVKESLKANKPLSIGYRARHKDGHEVFVSLNARIFKRDKKYRLIGVIRDVTYKKRAEEELQRTLEDRKELEQIINFSPAVVFLWCNKEGWPVEYVSENVSQFGYVPEDFYNQELVFADIIHPDDLERIRAEVSQFSQQELSEFIQEYRIITKKGETRWIDDRTWVRRDSEGKATHFQGIVLDITDRKRAEQNLKDSEEKYRILFNSTPFAVVLFTIDGLIYDCNDATEKITGYLKEDLIGSNFRELNLYKDIQKARVDERSKGMQKGIVPKPREVELYKKDGSTFWALSEISFINLGNQQYVQAIIHDVTEKKKIEEMILKEQQKAEMYLNLVNVLIVALDRNGNITLLNKSGYTILEWEEGELIGKSWFETCVPKHYKDDVFTVFKKLMNGEIKLLEFYENPIITKNGLEKLMAWHNTILYNDKEEIIGTISAGEDITERKKAEQLLTESEEKYRALFELAADSIILINVETGEIVDFNQKLLNTLGYTEEEFNKIRIPDFDLEENEEDYKLHINHIIENGFGVFETRYRTKDGQIRNILVSARAIKLKNKKFIQSVLHDITELKKAEKKIQKSEEKYREAFNRASLYKDLFAHDINNILQNIQSSAELSLIYQNDPEKLSTLGELLQIIKEQVIRGTKLVSNVRKITELEETEIVTHPLKLQPVIKEATEFIYKSFQTRQINIDLDLEKLDKDLYIKANMLVLDIFENLLFNAVRHNINPEVKIKIKCFKEKREEKQYIRLEFADNGMGISDDRKQIIFQREKAPTGKGMGLGLSLVKKIIDSVEGNIWVEDRVKGDYSKGSKFVVLIPEATP